jgi:hypothetical protein
VSGFLLLQALAFQIGDDMAKKNSKRCEWAKTERSRTENCFAERLIGSIRRECTDHFIVFDAEHLRRILAKYTIYYNTRRVTFRWERTRPADARSSGSETSLRMLSLAGCTIDTPESSFQTRQVMQAIQTDASKEISTM